MKQGALRNYVVNLVAGQEHDMHVTGEFFRVQDAEGGTISVTTDRGDSFTMSDGEGARIRAFESLRVRNDSGTNRRVAMIIGNGDFQSSRTTGEVAPRPAAGLEVVGDIAGGGTIPPNPARRQLVMRASVDNGVAVSIAGIPLQPGDTFELDVTGAVDVTGDALDVLHVAEVV